MGSRLVGFDGGGGVYGMTQCEHENGGSCSHPLLFFLTISENKVPSLLSEGCKLF